MSIPRFFFPRNRGPALRTPGQRTFDTEAVEEFLVAYGDDWNPLPETVKVLDEIVTDYIIETCHEAASCAHHARRAKIKLDDFKFMLRRDTYKLGRVSEMLETDKELKKKRKVFDTDEGAVAKEGEELAADDAKDGKEKGGKEGKGADKGGDEGDRKKKKRKKHRESAGKDDARSVKSG